MVLSLVENSLDALSSKIEVSVDFRRGCCVVEDNGNGIPASEFFGSGGLGKLYHTSKHSATDLHGSTGTYLASLSALSLLSITSRHEDEMESATLMIHQGKVIARHIPAAQIHELILSPTHGTKVTVRDLFGNMPVRVKQRALKADSGSDDEKAWQELKRGVVALLLAWPKPCSVKIVDLNDEKGKLKLFAQHPTVSHTLTEKSLNQLAGGKAKFELKDALPILFQAGLAPADSRTKWIPLSAASSNMSVKGSICLEPAPARACQFISLGIHPCAAKDGYVDLYDTMNRLFSNSSFGTLEDETVDMDDDEKVRRAKDRRYKQDGFTRKQVQVRKGVDRWPMFVMQVKFKDQTPSSERVSDKTFKAMMDILEAAVRQWLEAHHFRPRKKRQKKARDGEQSPDALISGGTSGRSTPANATPEGKRTLDCETASTSKRRKVLDLTGRSNHVEQESNAVSRPMSADFSTWSRIKSGRRTFYDEIWEGRKPQTAPEGQTGSVTRTIPTSKTSFQLPVLEAGELDSRKPPLSPNGLNQIRRPSSRSAAGVPATDEQKLSSDDFGSVDEDILISAAEKMEQDAGLETTHDAIVEWTEPNSNETFKVNSRTGVVLPTRPKSKHMILAGGALDNTPTRASAAINTSLTSVGLPLTLSKRPSNAKRRSEQWLPGFLKEWDNPVFTRQEEEPIPVASFDGPGIDVDEGASKCCTHDIVTKCFEHGGHGGTRKLSKAALRNAKILRQVDRKFILVKIQEAEGEVLVLVDQHAASERVILENLLSELCAPVDHANALTTGSKVRTTYLEKPLRFQIPVAEFDLCREHSTQFANWGILYDLRQRDEELSTSQVRLPKEEHIIIVKALPPGIAERCSLFPKLLIEMLRSEVHSLSSSTKRMVHKPHSHGSFAPSGNGSAENDESHHWLTAIGSCPKGILDMLNSRACRSAIMFNDEMLMEQCKSLLSELSKCAFPFMCAHSRVSMVPLAELGSVGGNAGTGGATAGFEEGRSGFVGAFRRWRGAYNVVDRDQKNAD